VGAAAFEGEAGVGGVDGTDPLAVAGDTPRGGGGETEPLILDRGGGVVDDSVAGELDAAGDVDGEARIGVDGDSPQTADVDVALDVEVDVAVDRQDVTVGAAVEGEVLGPVVAGAEGGGFGDGADAGAGRAGDAAPSRSATGQGLVGH